MNPRGEKGENVKEVRVSTATVYHGAKRRFLTKAAAYKSLAWSMWNKKHPCHCEGDVGYDCGFQGEYAEARVQRLLDIWRKKSKLLTPHRGGAGREG